MQMSKKRKTIVPQFGSAKAPGRPLDKNAPNTANAPGGAPPNAPRVKPPATSAKSGRRGA
jgi:hypothetical protein